jgi:hypothetical protein
MGLKKLKKENNFLNMKIIDLLSIIDTSETKKFTQFLVSMVKNEINARNNYWKECMDYKLIFDRLDPTIDDNQKKYSFFFLNSFFSTNQVVEFLDYCEFSEKNLISDKDISSFKTWDKIYFENYFARNKKEINNSKKEVIKIYEDEEFLIIKPLSHMASLTYGYGTKWCTSMVNEPEYFYRYSKEGILIYVINKKNSEKFGFYRKNFIGQCFLEIFNKEDFKIDSLETNIPNNLLQIILSELDTKKNKNNYYFFSEKELKKSIETVLDLPPPIIPISRDYLQNLEDELP